jgi:hypothetical protein
MEFVAIAKTAAAAAAPYATAAGLALTGVSALGSIEQGRQQRSAYKLQAQQVDLKSRREALQYEQQANLVLERMLQNNATASARGFAAGVSGFSGSAKLVQERSERVAGRDVEIMQEGGRNALSFGEVQSIMLREAGDQAMRGSYFDAFAKLGTAAYMYGQTAPGNVAASKTAVPAVPSNFQQTSFWKGSM